MKRAIVTGMKDVIKAIKNAKKEQIKGLHRGVKKAALLLQRESMKIVPVDTGNLRGSAFTRATTSGTKIRATVGYTAYYAIYVHEITWYNHAPGKFAKFLEWPARYMRKDMMQVIKDEVKIG